MLQTRTTTGFKALFKLCINYIQFVSDGVLEVGTIYLSCRNNMAPLRASYVVFFINNFLTLALRLRLKDYSSVTCFSFNLFLSLLVIYPIGSYITTCKTSASGSTSLTLSNVSSASCNGMIFHKFVNPCAVV